VTVFRNDGFFGYFAAGRKWNQGETEAVLEDEPGFPLEQKIAQLQHATGGQQLAGTGALPEPEHAYGLRGNGHTGEPERRAPALLEYQILERMP